MSLLIVIDPNILLGVAQSNRNCRWMLEAIVEDDPTFCLALDSGNQIFDAYESIGDLVRSDELGKLFLDKFVLQRLKRFRIPKSEISDDFKKELEEKFGVREPVEPELLFVGCRAPIGTKVFVSGEKIDNPFAKGRVTNSAETIDHLHQTYGSLQIWRACDFNKVQGAINRARHPGTEDELKTYIENCDENELIEYKQPGIPAGKVIDYKTEISMSIIIDSLKASAGMINCRGGKVFIGIKPNRELLGLDPVLNPSSRQPDDDILLRRFSDQLWRFNPPVNQYINPTAIPLSSGKRVIALHVEKGKNDIRYEYTDRNTISIYDRVGASTRRTKLLKELGRS